MSDDLTLDEWLVTTQEKRDELDSYSRSALPSTMEERHSDIDKSIQLSADSGALLADAESYLSQAKGIALMDLRNDPAEYTGRELDILVKARVRTVQRIVDGIHVTNRTLGARIFAIQNANRARL